MAGPEGMSGMDTAKAQELARALEAASDSVLACRERLNHGLASVGHAAPGELSAVAGWAEAQGRELRRRAVAISASNVLAMLRFDFAALVPLPAARFPTEAEAEAAGRRLAERYGMSFDEPARLRAFAGELRRYQTDPAFARAFVEAFGADRLLAVPRVIQAMEFQRAWTGAMPFGPHYRADIAWTEGPVDPQHLLAPFSSILARATRAGLDRNVERAIARHDDTLALSWLLSEGQFGTSFLLEAFRSGVVGRIEAESRARASIGYAGLDEGFPLGRMSGPGLPLDPKVGILGALARNPDAARLALAVRFDPPLWVSMWPRGEVEIGRADDLLLAAGEYEDRGVALGEMLASATARLNELGDRRAAAEVVEGMAHEAAYGRREVAGIVQGLSSALRDRHVPDLHFSAALGKEGLAFDPDEDGSRGMVDASGRLILSKDQLKDVLEAATADAVARERLLGAVAEHQAGTVLRHAGELTGAEGASWARGLGNFQQILVNANSETTIGNSEAARRWRGDVLAFLDAAVGLIPMGRGVGFVAGQVRRVAKDELGRTPGRDPRQVNDEFEQATMNGLDALIVSGYLERGLLGPEHAVVADAAAIAARIGADAEFVVDGHLVPYGAMTPLQRVAFLEWRNTEKVRQVAGEAMYDAHAGMHDRAKDD